jgi:multidrug transporter EmrE-like cation transporter
MTWFLLAIAILAEIVGTLLLKRSEGFTKLWPSIGVVLGFITAF